MIPPPTLGAHTHSGVGRGGEGPRSGLHLGEEIPSQKTVAS